MATINQFLTGAVPIQQPQLQPQQPTNSSILDTIMSGLGSIQASGFSGATPESVPAGLDAAWNFLVEPNPTLYNLPEMERITEGLDLPGPESMPPAASMANAAFLAKPLIEGAMTLAPIYEQLVNRESRSPLGVGLELGGSLGDIAAIGAKVGIPTALSILAGMGKLDVVGDAPKVGGAVTKTPKYYRAPGFEGGAPSDWSALRVIDEEIERGWVNPELVSDEMRQVLANKPATDIMWVSNSDKYLWDEFGPTDDWRGLIESKDQIEDVTDWTRAEGWRVLPINDEAEQILLVRDAPEELLIPNAKWSASHREAALGNDALGPSRQVKSTSRNVEKVGGALNEARAPKVADELLGNFPTTTPSRIRNQTVKTGGYTVHMQTGEVPQTGLLVGKHPNTDARNMVLTGKITNADLEAFAKANKKSLNKIGNYLGTWHETKTGLVYLDVSQRFEPDAIRKATKFGERTGQISGFDRGAFKDFQIGNWSDFIRTEEFAGRMKEMSVAGRKYLDTHSSEVKEWWDMYGTVFEDVYGTEHMESLAGYIASTAPNTNPTQNIRMASEYMRRHLLGEDIIQPNWRVPAGTQARTEGVMIGMEAGRVKNLAISQEGGRILDLSGDKVRNEAQALLGDPDAAVFDRWWARITEDADKGVYTATADGTFEDAKKTYNQYNDLLGVVRAAAKEQGRSARNYSADVWVGVRETVKETDHLFGAKFQGSALTGESKGYADLFADLIKSKAEFLGVSVAKFKSRLAAGDAELLTLVLGAPLGAHVFSQLDGVGSDIAPTPGDQRLAGFL